AIMILGAFGFMLGAGGSAEVGRALGEGKPELAKRYFTTLILTIITIGTVLCALVFVFIEPLSRLLGATDLLIDDCIVYGRILAAGNVFFMLQSAFQTFFVLAEKPKLGLLFTLSSGFTNIIFDFVFVYLLEMGVAGAAIATVMGYAVGGVIPLFYFARKNSSLLHFTKTEVYPRMLLASAANGSSEMVSNISSSVVTMLYNWQMLRLLGEGGVASITVIMYINFIFVAVNIGFAIGAAPIVSYHYGAQNKDELRSIFRKSLTVIGVVSLAMFVLAEGLSSVLISLFLSSDPEFAAISLHGLRIASVSFLLAGVNIYASSFFTALCNGKVSAIISFLRALVFPVAALLTLPYLLDVEGVWLSLVISEALAFAVSVFFLIFKRKKYGYA
ncbi:MAG TPA: MATE family efflux transporter, partial [Clostridiales bacterium]|nr:MATE family efflux transporter [Clostridiales bacterium]